MESELITVAVDHEFDGDDWWENGGGALWHRWGGSASCRPFQVLRSERARLIAACEKIAGWNGGSPCAPHPLVIG